MLTLAIYYVGPIDWSGRSSGMMGLFVVVCLLAFNIGTLLPVRAKARPAFSIPMPRKTSTAYALLLSHVVLTAIYLIGVTGKNPFLPSSYSLDFGRVYAEYGEHLKTRDYGLAFQVITFIKAMLFPFVLMAFFDRFKRDRIYIGIFLGTLTVSSLMRGTDKEFVDILILVGVALYYMGLLTRRVWLITPLITAMLYAFLLRRLGRFSGGLPRCLPQSEACFDYQGPLARTFGPDVEILWIFVCNYVSQGYQGLYLAMKLPFDFNFFLGHLPPLKRSVCVLVTSLCDVPEYNDKLMDIGWDTSTKWTTVYTFLANDFSFYLVPLYMFMLGVVFKNASQGWRVHKDIPSVCALFLVTQFFVYSSANMQIAISLDWAFSTILFIYVGLFRYIGRLR